MLLQIKRSETKDEGRFVEEHLRPMVLRSSTQISMIISDNEFDLYSDASAPSAFETVLEGSFTDLTDARNRFQALSRELQSWAKIHIRMKCAATPLFDRLTVLQEYLDQWFDKFNALPIRQDIAFDERKDHYLLRIKYHLHRIALKTIPFDDEVYYDTYLDNFRAIVDLCAEFFDAISPLSSQSGTCRTKDNEINTALCFVGCSCRDPTVRRRAIRLLYRDRRLEGIWSSVICGVYAEQVMMLEEDGLDYIENQDDIPALKRVRIISCDYFPGFLNQAPTANIKQYRDLPSLKLNFVYPMGYSKQTASVIIPLEGYHIMSELGCTSTSWWPASRTGSLLNEVVDEKRKHCQRPFLGNVPWTVIENRNLESMCSMRRFTLSFIGST